MLAERALRVAAGVPVGVDLQALVERRPVESAVDRSHSVYQSPFTTAIVAFCLPSMVFAVRVESVCHQKAATALWQNVRFGEVADAFAHVHEVAQVGVAGVGHDVQQHVVVEIE